MQKATIQEHLALAREHIEQGEKSIERQRRVVADLQNDGHAASQACKLLTQFQELQALHIADRDRLERELADNADGD
jgi:hypothetical protein